MTILAVAAGFAADLAFGDPRWLPHPVVAMGRAITWAEGRLRGAFPQTSAGTRAAGLVLAVALPLACGLLTWGILHLCGMVHSGLRFVAEAWASYQILAACELRRQSLAVARAFSKDGLVAAREAVGLIVGRDTSVLDEHGVARAAVETVAENASDGVIAPLFYLMIGGAPLGMAYKAVNTLDSMVGYKNERYIDFGCASARLDDALNWIPSRLSALLMIAVCPIVGLDARGAARIWRRDRRRHASPNAAQTESACAGALGLRLAGPAVYFGKLVEKPTIGDASREIQWGDIARATRLMLAASVCALVVFGAARGGRARRGGDGMRKDHAAPRAAGGILRARTHGGSAQSLGIACEGGASDLIDFSVNVNPAGPSPRAVAAACKALSRIDAYPDRESLALVRALARDQGIPEDTIVCGAGASDIIWRLAAAVRPKRIVVCAPTFSEYAEAASYYGACVQEFPLSEADDFDVPASFARAIEGPGDVAYLCNPNNPTGRLVDPRVIDAAACRCEQVGALLVVDECFLGFASDARERSVAARAACSRHVAVLSAFTKLYGMAGLRLGYLISGNAQLIEGIRRAGQAWPVSSVAEAAGIAALEDVEYVSRTRDVLEGERAWLSHELSSLGLSVVPSDANFLLVRTPAKDIPERLYDQGVLVRTCDSFSVLSRFWCRVAVRTRKENARLAMAFGRALRAEDASGEGEPDERGGASFSGAMAGADGRGLAKEVDTRG